MKKFILTFLIGISLAIMASCEYDDSNDIDILTPNDSTETGFTMKKLPQ